MRNLKRNSKSFYVVSVVGEIESVDTDGNYTGDIEKIYTVPKKISLSTYPADGMIVEHIFGTSSNFDLIATSNLFELKRGDLLFEIEPTSDYEKTFDYRVGKINKSINTFQYGLECRVHG